MDKDNRDDFTFAKLSDLKLPVTLRMSAPFVVFIVQQYTHQSRVVRSLKDLEFPALLLSSWRNLS
jgi:hypothetical protein